MNLALSVIAWYLTSIVCTATTREIHFVSKITLTLNQFVMYIFFFISNPHSHLLQVHTLTQYNDRSVICSYVCCGFKPKPLKKNQKPKMWILALSFLIGMFTLNLAIGVMHVSLAMTLRAVEPLFTLALGYYFSGSVPNISALASLLLIVAGAGLSSMSSLDYNTMGLLLVIISNLSFATRAIFYKDIKIASGLNSFEMFYEISRYVIVLAFFIWFAFVDPFENTFEILFDLSKLFMLLLNGVCFFAYVVFEHFNLISFSCSLEKINHIAQITRLSSIIT